MQIVAGGALAGRGQKGARRSLVEESACRSRQEERLHVVVERRSQVVACGALAGRGHRLERFLQVAD